MDKETALKLATIAGIEDVATYQRHIPLTRYEQLQEAVRCIAAGAADVLFAGHPIAFEYTGGTSGGKKLIPYTDHSLLDFRHALLQWLKTAISSHSLREGYAYWALSPATRKVEKTSNGIAIGLPDEAYLGRQAGPLFAALSAVPPELAQTDDVFHWQRETLYWLLLREDLVLISIWSPTFFISLLDALPRHAPALLARFSGKNISAAHRLKKWLAGGEAKYLWPGLRLVSCWADASSRPYYEALRQLLPHAGFQPKGLLSTEGVVTIPDANGRPVLAADSGFYEFLGADGRVYPSWCLRVHMHYGVILTTAGGLYRYHTGDQVVCTGHAGELPILRFTGRCGQSSDLVGEKLTDDFVANCLDGIPGFRLLLPRPHPAGYILVHEGCHTMPLELIEERLCQNPQYAHARRVGQLWPLAERQVSDALSLYTAHALRQGQRLGVVKIPALGLDGSWLP